MKEYADGKILVEIQGPVTTVIINRAEVRNALDNDAARGLGQALRDFDADDSQLAAVLTGTGGAFCAGADLKAVADSADYIAWAGDAEGPTNPTLSKPVIAAVEGHAVAGGLGIALWCDIRLVDETAVFGVFCRRWGVPMSDGTTVRLPRLIGAARALDMLITGRGVGADEAIDAPRAQGGNPAGSRGTGPANRRLSPDRHAFGPDVGLPPGRSEPGSGGAGGKSLVSGRQGGGGSGRRGPLRRRRRPPWRLWRNLKISREMIAHALPGQIGAGRVIVGFAGFIEKTMRRVIAVDLRIDAGSR